MIGTGRPQLALAALDLAIELVDQLQAPGEVASHGWWIARSASRARPVTPNRSPTWDGLAERDQGRVDPVPSALFQPDEQTTTDPDPFCCQIER